MQFTTRQVEDIRRSVQISMIFSDKTDLFSHFLKHDFSIKKITYIVRITHFCLKSYNL